jgi:ATP-dependent protease HslVU (ClpYQ) peptidase subunit
MTLCTAAACLNATDKPRIVVSSDWLAEVGTLAGAEVQNKLYWLFKGKWCVLIAGTVPAALSLLTTIRRSIDPKKLTRSNIEDRLAKAALNHRDKLVKRYVRRRHSVTYEYFRAHKSEFDEGQWTETQSGILGMELDCLLIVCTFIKGTPFIFQVNEDCSVIREENFAAIGSGSDVANAMLCYRQQNEELSIEETAYNLFEATKFARKAKVPGVGKLHAFSVLYPHRRQRRLRERGLRQLKKYFKRYGPQRVKKLGLPKGSWQPYE